MNEFLKMYNLSRLIHEGENINILLIKDIDLLQSIHQLILRNMYGRNNSNPLEIIPQKLMR